jgi:hypothetical protein
MKKYVHWIAIAGLLLGLVALRAWAASSETETMTPRASEAWSRGRMIGHTPVKQPVTLQPAPGGGVFLIWPNLDGQLELAHIGADGDVRLDRVLPVAAHRARNPQLAVGPEGRLHLLWREQSGSRTGVHYAILEADGSPASRSQALSDPASRVRGAPRLAQDAQGRFHAMWVDDAGVQWTMLDGQGHTLAGPALLVSDGHSLQVRTDDAGRLHLAWQQEPRTDVREVYYTTLDPDAGKLNGPQEVAQIVLNERLQLEDVAFGIGHDTGYVLWSEYDEGFDRYLFGYASFPLSAPDQAYTDLYHLKLGDGPTAISLPDGPHTPLPVVLSERIIDLGDQPEPTSGRELAHYVIKNEGVEASGLELRLQITRITLGEGTDHAVEQVITASPQASMKPVLAIDDSAHHHLAWLETGGFGQYRLIYASTAPEVLESYNALTAWDIVNVVFSKLFRLSLVVVAAVLAFITWAIIPLLGLAGYHLVTSDETLSKVRSQVALVTVLAVEVALTLALPPRIASVETGIPALRWGIPSVAAIVATAVTASVVRRREDVHLFAAFFLFTALNNLLQMALYLLA